MSLLVRLKGRARELKAEVHALFFAAKHPRTPWYAKILMLAIVAYALSPIDLIPDFIPVLGFLDEIVLLPVAIILVLKLVPAAVMMECRARAAANATVSTRAGRIGAVVILMLWLALVIAIGTWANAMFA